LVMPMFKEDFALDTKRALTPFHLTVQGVDGRD